MDVKCVFKDWERVSMWQTRKIHETSCCQGKGKFVGYIRIVNKVEHIPRRVSLVKWDSYVVRRTWPAVTPAGSKEDERRGGNDPVFGLPSELKQSAQQFFPWEF